MIVGRTLRVACGVAVAALLAAGCGDGSDGEVVVFAAASLTESFGEIEIAFEAENPGVDVVLNFAGSSALREQLLDGAPADVFASANLANIGILSEAGIAQGVGPQFATNELTLAVQDGNPAGITGLDDLARPELSIGLCAVEVPCGWAADRLLTQVGIVAEVDTYEPNVAALTSRLADGELDAGLIYVTDVFAAQGRLEPIVTAEATLVNYAIASMIDAGNIDGANSFIEFVMSPVGQNILIAYGFSPGRT